MLFFNIHHSASVMYKNPIQTNKTTPPPPKKKIFLKKTPKNKTKKHVSVLFESVAGCVDSIPYRFYLKKKERDLTQ